MNVLRLKYSLGLTSPNDIQQRIQQIQFEKLIENITHYNDLKTLYPLDKKFLRINALDINTFNNSRYYLTGMDNGSISLWAFDDANNDSFDNTNNYRLINKRLKTSKGKKISNTIKDTRDTGQKLDGTRLIHSFETRYNKFRLYRGNSNESSTMPNDTTNKKDENIYSHQYGIKCLKWYGNDDGMFFSAGYDKTIKIWDTNTFETVQDIEFNYEINQIDNVKSELNYILVASEDYYPRLIDLRNMNLGITIFGKSNKNSNITNMKSPILSCKVNPIRDNIIASSDEDGRIKLWDLRMRNKLLVELQHNDDRFNNKAHVKSCNDLVWNENGKELISIGLDGKILKWEPFNNTLQRNSQQIGDIDVPRNKYKKRTSQRLLMHHNYLFVNTDYSELQIFDTVEGKFWNKVEFPKELLTAGQSSSGMFNGMAIQQDLTNSKGLRLLVGANNTSNTTSSNRNNIVEYA